MTHVQVRNVPAGTHAALVRRARQEGKSLQQFLSEKLETIATTPTLDDVLDRIENRTKGDLTADAAADAIAADRDRR